jgi:hypothetical protein
MRMPEAAAVVVQVQQLQPVVAVVAMDRELI